MILGFVYALAGLVVLSLAGDQFVKGAARLAILLRISPIAVGAVIIGFGTSAPEMVVSGLAAAEGQLDIGVGNVVGSNVANISLVLGSAALMTAIPVSAATVRRDGLTSVLAVACFALLLQNSFERWEGVLLVSLLVVWLAMLLYGSRSSAVGAELDAGAAELGGVSEFVRDGDEDALSAWRESLRTVIGLAVVIVSAYFLVDGAERVADAFGFSGGFVGYTLVAVGTSAPEIVTAIAAARQREVELLVGNLLGSNVFNSLAVGGLISLVGSNADVDVSLQTIGAALMVLICFLSWVAMATGRRVTRWEGIFLLFLWIGSAALLWLLAGGDAEAVTAAAGQG